jgi:hypothetical protein
MRAAIVAAEALDAGAAGRIAPVGAMLASLASTAER